MTAKEYSEAKRLVEAAEALNDFLKDLEKVENKIKSVSFYGEDGVKVSLWHTEKDADLVQYIIAYTKSHVNQRISDHQTKFQQL